MDRQFYNSSRLYCCLTEKKRQYFYEDGTLRTLEFFKNGKLDGVIRLYWPNGQLKRLCHFKEGLREGIDRMYSVTGVLIDDGSYAAGKPIGTHRRFNGKAQLIEEIEHLDTVRMNLRLWDDRGTICVEAQWVDDENYVEKVWDRFKGIWIYKKGVFDGRRLVYL